MPQGMGWFYCRIPHISSLPVQLPSAGARHKQLFPSSWGCVLTSHMRLLINTAAVPGGQKLKIIILLIHNLLLTPELVQPFH